MSKERCEATKQLMRQALGILQSEACGKGRGVSLAITYLEDAYLRVDFHMREQGWVDTNGAKQAVSPAMNPQAMAAASQQRIVPRVNNLAPAASIPQLKTGLMNTPVAATDPSSNARVRPEHQEDLDLL